MKFIWDWWEMYNVENCYKINVVKEKSMKWIFLPYIMVKC